ncbi:MAG: 3-deoxy-D-manno-octulosonic acid transferase [Alphaproteobacteria bacterium]|nr:3-deoxy-D-manno-octulosonic acid transferase [Alphaproteobacteria bacterium]MBU0859607.1 3-deoxy-D-manno-octulosonic acid transferase [Alphaproteobacteria bacterium]
MGKSGPFLRSLLARRARASKEDPARLPERMGTASLPRPAGKLVWLHAASVGEAQSALILLDALLERDPSLHVLVTTGTVNSATHMARRLPARAMHQFVPMDHPQWVAAFLDHWRPDRVLWMESELWPNMLAAIKSHNIPAVLINARLSARSVKRWRLVRKTIADLLSTFTIILAQTEDDAANFRALGAARVVVTDNIKYAAAPLPLDDAALPALFAAIGARPIWVYASTHDGEEDLACRLHTRLSKTLPDLLTIIVPRHPERRAAIVETCARHNLPAALRSTGALPTNQDAVYIADTMGELGLFYRIAPLACIGRSFSNDGGGGHNPIEAAQLGCAVIHGPHIQNLAALFDEMNAAGAALRLRDEADFEAQLTRLLTNSFACDELRDRGAAFVMAKAQILDRVMSSLAPVMAAA